jgi:hypothetical protein
MIKPILALLATLTIGQSSTIDSPPSPPGIQAQSLPAISEPSWTFTDGPNTYIVGKQTGAVTVLRPNGQPAPAPPGPPPVPTPPAPVKPASWATLILPSDQLTPQWAALRTDPDIRTALEQSRTQYRSYLDNEVDIDRLNFRNYAGLVNQLQIPQLVLQAQDGTVLTVKPIQSKADLLNAVR